MINASLKSLRKSSFEAGSYAISFDGNSISDQSVSTLVPTLNAISPVSSKFTISNYAINGQTTLDMISGASDVDGSYVLGKTNVLIVWELTNNIHNIGRTGAQTISDTISYITARQQYVTTTHPGQKPWVVILMTGLCRGSHLGGYFTAADGEIEMQYCNNYIRNHYKDMGAWSYVEVRRAGGPFDFSDPNNGLNYPPQLWTDRTHPSNGVGGGKEIIAGYIADVLRRLPARLT